MINRRTFTHLTSNTAATLAALSLSFGYLAPRPCLCLGCEAGATQKPCCCKATARDCCQKKSCCAKSCHLQAPAESLACDGCSCGSATEPAIAIPVAPSHEDGDAAPAAFVGQPAAMAPAESTGVLLVDVALTGSPPGIRLHSLYSVWLN